MLDVRVLGRLAVLRDGAPVPVPGGRRGAVLARLVAAGGAAVSGARLLDDVWGEDPGPTAANGLQVAVWTLRKRLAADTVLTTPVGYALGPSVGTDLDRFAAAVAEGERRAAQGDDLGAVATYIAALAEFTGTPFEGIDAPFADAQRAAVAERRLTAVGELAAARIRLGIAPPVVAELAPLVEEHPFREELHATYALALARVGRRVEALEVIDRARRRLRQQFGVDAGASLADAQQAILHDELPAGRGRPSSVQSGLHRMPPPMLGRDGELQDLLALLRRRGNRLVTVLGAAGVGKTRLAEAVVESGGATACFVSLLGARQLDDLPSVVAAELGVTVDADGAEAAVVDAMARSASIDLLVLDNLEHVPEAARFVERLLAAVPGLSVLTTSREPLYIAAEQRFRLRPLPVEPGRTADAEALFLAVAARRDPTFAPSAADAAALELIVRACDGLPLALELAASWTDVLTVTEIADRLGAHVDLLVEAGRSTDDRSSSVRASVGWSLERVPPAAAQTLRAACVFVGGSTLRGLAAVTGLDEAVVRDHVAVLVDRSLLAAVPRSPGRFDVLQVIRELALEDAPDEAVDALRAAHLAHVHSRITRPRRSRAHPSTADDLRLLRAEAPNIRAAIRYARSADAARFTELLESISSGWLLSGLEDELVSWTTAALELPDLTPAQRFDALLAAERAVGSRGGSRGRELLRDAGSLEHLVDRDRRLALAIRTAYAPVYLGELDEASARATRLRSMLEPGDEPEVGLLTDQLEAVVLVERGEPDRGIAMLQRVSAEAKAAGLELHSRIFDLNLSEVLLWQGRADEALRISTAQLAELPADAVQQRAIATRNAGLALLLQGRSDEAEVVLRLAIGQLRGRTHVADHLTIALAFAGALDVGAPEDRAFLLGAWEAGAAAGEVPPTDIDQRLLASVPTGSDPGGGRTAARTLLDSAGIGALVDAVDAVIARGPVRHRRHA